MSTEGIPTAVEQNEGVIARGRAALRRVMPHVAIAAAALCVLWLLVGGSAAVRQSGLREIFGLITFVVVACTAFYYGYKGLRGLKRRLLWRVRRRLIITYLFVGLTPILLLAALGFLVVVAGLNQAIVRVVSVQMSSLERQTLASARLLAETLARLPANADERSVQAQLDEQVALLQASLPGARVAVWRAGSGNASPEASNNIPLAVLGESSPAQFISEPEGEEVRGVGGDTTPLNAPLPEWVRGYEEWGGLAYFPPPPQSTDAFGTPSVRALVRRAANGRAVTLLLVVPISPALTRELRAATGIHLHPFFIGAERVNFFVAGEGRRAQAPDPQPATENRPVLVVGGNLPESEVNLSFQRDQLGEPTNVSSLPNSIVLLQATNWPSGAQSARLTFMYETSLAQASRQLWEDNGLGRIFHQVFIGIAIFFLVLELLALLSAAWITRAVTGTVHKLYVATEHIKRGDFSHRAQVRSHDQLGELAEAFNEMSANIESLLSERVERERLEREVEIAAEVQRRLFPPGAPPLERAEIAGECRAARGVAGDYYDFIEIAPGLVVLALGDVSGKGISASLVMSNLQAALRAQTTIFNERLKISQHALAGSAGGEDVLSLTDWDDAEMQGSVAAMVASINEQLRQSTDDNLFATLFLALYQARARHLRYLNAGHNAGLLIRAGGAVERLTVGGTIIGVFEWARYEEESVTLETDDLLLLFSDGITEAQNSLGEEYGEARLLAFAQANRHLTAGQLRQAIFSEIETWSGDRDRDDDQTLVILKTKEV